MPNPKKLLDALYGGAKEGGAVHMQDGGKLPPGIKRAIERAGQSKSVLPVAGARQARQAIQGYLGMDPSFSVMDPEAQALESAYRGGETASVLGDLFASLTPFATASALSKVNQIPGASMAVRRGRASVPQQVNLQMAREEAEKIGQSASPYERSLQQGYGHGWFHGTTGDIEQFKKSLRGEATGAPSAKKGFFFARDPESPPQHMLDELRSSHEGALKVLKDSGVPQEKIVDDFKGMAGHGAETASGYSQLGGSRQYKEAMRKSNAALKKGNLTEYSRELEKAEDIAIGGQRYLQSLVAKVGDARDDMLDSIQKAVYSKELPQAEAEALDKKFKALMPYGWYRSYSNEQINNLKKELIDLTGKEGADSAIKKLEKYMSLRNEEDLALKTLEGSNVMPIALRYKNPLVHDFQGSSYRDITYSNLMDEAIRQGKDALILKNTYDPGASTAKLIDVGIVFEPNQIRSKFAAFDPTRINESDLLAGIGALSAGAVAPEVVKQLNRANEKPSEEVDINGEPQMAKGGRVRISDNPDTMLLELLRKKHG